MVAANGIYKLAVIGTVQGQQHIHTLHFRSTLEPDGLTDTETVWMTELVTTWQGAPAAAYRALMGSTELPVRQFQVRKVCGTSPLPAGVDISQPAGSQAGTGVAGEFQGLSLAPWLSTVTTVRTGFAGRRYRGRSYIGGLEETMVTGATVSADRVSRLTSYFNALLAAFVTPDEVSTKAKWFVYSRTIAEEEPTTPCQNTGGDVVGFQVRDQLASMKSRKAGSGL
jgi:hypothetical protein